MPDFTAAALASARRYCGWHVTPLETTTVTFDGPGGPLLTLPTLCLDELVSVKEDGIILDVGTLLVSPLGLVRKRSGAYWSANYGAIQVMMSHGYVEAPDFDEAVEMIGRSMGASSTRDDPALTGKKVDDVEYNWSVTLLQQAGAGVAASMLAPYRLERQP